MTSTRSRQSQTRPPTSRHSRTMANLVRVEFHAPENGTEVLWAERIAPTRAVVLSVPVFTFGVSRGTHIALTATNHEDLWLADGVTQESESSTVRLYCSDDWHPRRILAEAQSGPFDFRGATCTLLAPDILAVDVAGRPPTVRIRSALDELVRRHVCRFWELSDPDYTGDEARRGAGALEWRLEHELPVVGGMAGSSIA